MARVINISYTNGHVLLFDPKNEDKKRKYLIEKPYTTHHCSLVLSALLIDLIDCQIDLIRLL